MEPNEAPNPTPPSSPELLPPGENRVRVDLVLPEGARVQVVVEARDERGQPLDLRVIEISNPPGAAFAPKPGARARARQVIEKATWGVRTLGWLPLLSFAIYLGVRLIGLAEFPIFFFCDEAVQAVLASDFLRDGFHAYTGELLPAFFPNSGMYNLGVTVYLNLLPVWLFGRSVEAVRGVTVAASLLAALAVARSARDAFGLKHSWLAVLALSATPAWFLHSRTGFEVATAVSFYAVMLCCYWIYRGGKPVWLLATAAAGALTFYSYSPGQMVVGLTGLLFLVIDAPYHWKNWRVVLAALGLAALLSLPYFRHQALHPGATAWHLKVLSSYWVSDLTVGEKVGRFVGEYLRGLNPGYWFAPNPNDLPRHVMKGYGHLAWGFAPFFGYGLWLSVRRLRQPAYATLLAALLAAPSGAALAELGVTRALFIVIPAALLTAIGLHGLIDALSTRWHWRKDALAWATFAALAAFNLWMATDALTRGPVWFSDYTLTGMQWGARQVFSNIAQHLAKNPADHVVLSPAWANATDVTARFFFGDPIPFEMRSPSDYYQERLDLTPQTLLVLTADEYAELPTQRFSEVRVENILYYPDGRPGFYFLRLKYALDFDAQLAAEEADRQMLREGFVLVNGVEARVLLSRLDMGKLEDLFDGNPDTLARSDINPFKVQLNFSQPVPARAVKLRIGGGETQVRLQVWLAGQAEPQVIEQTFESVVDTRTVTLALPTPGEVSAAWVEAFNPHDVPSGNVHLWEVQFE